MKLDQFKMVCNDNDFFVQLMGKHNGTFLHIGTSHLAKVCRVCNIWEPTKTAADKNHPVILKSSPVLDSVMPAYWYLQFPCPSFPVPGPHARKQDSLLTLPSQTQS